MQDFHASIKMKIEKQALIIVSVTPRMKDWDNRGE